MRRLYPATSIVAPGAAPVSVAMLGGTFASVLWALCWAAVAVVAIGHASHARTGSAALAVIVSVMVSGAGCVVAWHALWSDHRWVDAPAPRESFGRRVVGWFAAMVWCGVGAAWNFGVFGSLFRAAAEGRGIFLTVMVLWSLIGWLLLHILFIGLGSIVDWGIRAAGYGVARRGR